MKKRVVIITSLLSVLIFSACQTSDLKETRTLAETIQEESLAINVADNWIKPADPVAPGLEDNENVKIVQGFFGAYGNNDLEGIREVMADDVEWFISGRHPLAGTKKGVEQVVAFFGLLQRAGFKAEPLIFSANDNYVIDAHRGWSNTGENDIDVNWILVYQIEEGKIKRVQNFSADPYVTDTLFDSLYSEEDTKLVRTEGLDSLKETIEAESYAINEASQWVKPVHPVSPGLEGNENVGIVQGFFGAYGNNDLEGIRAVMADDVEWFIPGRHPLAGTKRGVEQVTAFFGLLQRAGFKAEPLIFSANDNYVIDAHRGWSNTGENDIDVNWILVYQIENGKIKKVQNFSADPYISDALFNALYTEEDTKLVR
jgi:ketosteroid isomerase-like protein